MLGGETNLPTRCTSVLVDRGRICGLGLLPRPSQLVELQSVDDHLLDHPDQHESDRGVHDGGTTEIVELVQPNPATQPGQKPDHEADFLNPKPPSAKLRGREVCHLTDRENSERQVKDIQCRHNWPFVRCALQPRTSITALCGKRALEVKANEYYTNYIYLCQ